MARLVVLASGQGTNFQALIDRKRERIVALFCNHKAAFAMERARQAGIPAHYVPLLPFRERGLGREEYDADLGRQVAACAPDLVVLAGWMHVLGPAFLDAVPYVINLHPALLPDDPRADRVVLPDGRECAVYRGNHSLEAALQDGVSYVGSSVHRVTSQVDRGPLILKTVIPIHPGESFASVRTRLLEVEHSLLPDAVDLALASIRRPAIRDL